MKIFILIILSSFALHAQTWKNYHIQKYCDVYKLNGEKVKSFPGNMCLFFEDGTFLSASMNGLKLIRKDFGVSWTIPGEYHHQLNLSHDGNSILALSTKYVADKKGKKVGIDRLLVIDKEGKILHETLTDWMYKTLKNTRPWSEAELTHFNSFHSIPKITVKDVPNYIKEGNYILNAYTMGIFILSPDLKTILHYQKFPTSTGHLVHDVQILPNGHYLFFNNIDSRSSEELRFSSVQEIDTNGKVVMEFPKDIGPLFFSLHMGGVQILDDNHWLISHALLGGYIYAKKEKKIINYIHKTHYEHYRFLPGQQVYLKNLSSFLMNWR